MKCSHTMQRLKPLVSLVISLSLAIPVYAFSPKGSEIRLDSSQFSNNLSASDDNVQKALDTLDNLSVTASINWQDIGGTQSSVNVSGFTNDAGFLLQDSLSDYVPTSRTINGKALTSDITIDGMIYPSAGIPVSTGSIWGTSISGTSAQFIKGDGSLDGSLYLTTESDTLNAVTGRGATTTYRMTVGNLTVTDDGSASVTVNAIPSETYGTGGDTVENITVGSDTYRVHKFTTVGNATFIAPTPARNVEVLVVAGGGSGGSGYGGGGGAGELNYNSSFPVTGGASYSVTIGAGGLANGNRTAYGQDGGDSVFGTIQTRGGGAGAYPWGGSIPGRAGGSSGGSSNWGGTPPNSTAYVLGYKGGTSGSGTAGGGGGGSSSNGTASGTTSTGGAGGSGTVSSIDGTSTTYAVGGKGGNRAGNAVGASATLYGSGGAGGDTSDAYSNISGGHGKQGVVIVRYLVSGSTVAEPQLILEGTGVQKAILKTDGADSDKIKLLDKDNVELLDIAQTSGNSVFTGSLAASNLSGTNTGDQFSDGVTITGDGTFIDPFVAEMPDVSGLVAKTDVKTLRITGDFYGAYLFSPYIRITIPDLGYGYDIKTVVVQCGVADPVTEINSDLMWSDSQGVGAFPGANQTVIMAMDSVTGDFSWSGTSTVATNKELFIRLNSNVDYGVPWSIVLTYQLRTS